MTVFRAKPGDVEVEGLAGLKRAGDSLEDHAAPDDNVPHLEIRGCSQEPRCFFEVADEPDVLRFHQRMFSDLEASGVSAGLYSDEALFSCASEMKAKAEDFAFRRTGSCRA